MIPQDLNLKPVEVVNSKSGPPTLKIGDTWVHDPEDPIEKAEQWIQGLRYVPHSLIVLWGMGLGYEIRALLKRMQPIDKLLIIEPREDVFQLFKEHNQDLSKYRLYRVKDWVEFKNAFMVIGDWKYITVASIPSYLELYPREHEEFIELMNRELNNLQSDVNTTNFFCKRWQENLFKNLKHVGNSGRLSRSIGKYLGPAIIVSAGPSLENNIHLLEKAKGKALIIATQTTNRVFESMDIKPDLIFSFDGGYDNYYEHFQDVVLDVPLVYDLTLYWKVLPEWKGKHSLMLVHPANRWVEDKLECRLGGFMAGPSISNTMLDIAIQLGANPIIFIGQDLAYSGGRFHASGTHRNEIWDSGIPIERSLVEIDGQDGSRVISDKSMIAYLHWFEEIYRLSYKDKGTKLINSTEGGADIKCMENMSFQEAIDKYCRSEPDIQELVDSITEKPKWNTEGLYSYLKECREKLRMLEPSLQRAIHLSTELIVEVSKRNTNYGSMKHVLKELSEIDERVDKFRFYLDPLHYVIRPGLDSLERCVDTKKREAVLTAKETYRRYKTMMDAMEFVNPLMEEF